MVQEEGGIRTGREGHSRSSRRGEDRSGWRQSFRAALGQDALLYRLQSWWPSSDAFLLTACCLVAMLVIAPFAAISWGRLGPGWVSVGLIALMLFFSLAALFVALTNRTHLTGMVVAVVGSASATLALVIDGLGMTGAWALAAPAVMANFFITRARLALVLATMIGVFLLLHAPPEAAGDDMIAFVTALLGLVVLSFLFSWHWSSQQQQLGLLARRDPLTDAGNRRSLELDLQARVTSRRRGEACAIALLDLDNFKRLNDSFGHAFGDQVLVGVVETAEQVLRAGDRIYRFGGDEFAIVFPATPSEGVRPALSKLHDALGRQFEQFEEPVTVSTGAASLELGESADSWLRRADEALYRAKAAGRNCFRIDEGSRSGGAQGVSRYSLAKQVGRAGDGSSRRQK